MLLLKILCSLLSVLFVIDFYSRFMGGNAGNVSTGLCRPFFGIFYPKMGMVTGLLCWILEGVLTVSGVICWFQYDNSVVFTQWNNPVRKHLVPVRNKIPFAQAPGLSRDSQENAQTISSVVGRMCNFDHFVWNRINHIWAIDVFIDAVMYLVHTFLLLFDSLILY